MVGARARRFNFITKYWSIGNGWQGRRGLEEQRFQESKPMKLYGGNSITAVIPELCAIKNLCWGTSLVV